MILKSDTIPSAMKAKVSSNRNFSKLFQYISGNNEKNEKIAMTTPVYMTEQNGKSYNGICITRLNIPKHNAALAER